jgi:hypothetical protein
MGRLKKPVLPLLFAAAVLAACSPRTIALRETAALVRQGAPALYEEPDTQFARESLGSNLKLLEVLLRDEPENRDLLSLAAEGFGGYAFLFLEDSQPERAKGFYLRGRDYGLRLAARNTALAKLAEQDLDSARAALQKAGPADAPGLFWAAFGWAGYINLSKDSPSALAELPKAVALMERARQLAPDYHFAGADLFFGIYYASRPAILGGDLKKAQAAFQEARRRTGGKYLMTYVLEAKYFAVGSQDQEAFKSLLQKVNESPAGQLPNALLTDQVAKEKANQLLEKMNDLF